MGTSRRCSQGVGKSGRWSLGVRDDSSPSDALLQFNNLSILTACVCVRVCAQTPAYHTYTRFDFCYFSRSSRHAVAWAELHACLVWWHGPSFMGHAVAWAELHAGVELDACPSLHARHARMAHARASARPWGESAAAPAATAPESPASTATESPAPESPELSPRLALSPRPCSACCACAQ